MPRTDIHLDAMLRHLGAAYYESLQGRATRSDVTRALDNVAEHLGEQRQPAFGGPRVTGPRGGPGGGPRGSGRPARDHGDRREAGGSGRPRGWSRRVGDVMTTSVVTVDRITPYKEIARLLAEHRISGMPVLKMGREVVGVVTEADLLEAQAGAARRLRWAARRSWWPRGSRHPALTAGELMTAPAVTIGPHATVPAAARLMTAHHVRRLPVTSEKGMLLGVVSRRDLLSVFLRPDEDIAADVRRVLDDILLTEPGEADVAVRNGIVTLTGTLSPRTGPHGDLVPLALQLMWDVDGVVDIVDRLGESRPVGPGPDGAGLPDGPAPPVQNLVPPQADPPAAAG
jgi:CBS domain-containing protein